MKRVRSGVGWWRQLRASQRQNLWNGFINRTSEHLLRAVSDTLWLWGSIPSVGPTSVLPWFAAREDIRVYVLEEAS